MKWLRMMSWLFVLLFGCALLACGDNGPDRSDGTRVWVDGVSTTCKETESRRGANGLWESNAEVAERVGFSHVAPYLLKARNLCREAGYIY